MTTSKVRANAFYFGWKEIYAVVKHSPEYFDPNASSLKVRFLTLDMGYLSCKYRERNCLILIDFRTIRYRSFLQ